MSLQSLGVTQYGEKIYKALLARGKCTAKELSKHSGVPPTAVYPAVAQLEEQGLVQRIDGVVQHFEAVDPRTALHQLTTTKITQLESTKKQLEKELRAVKRKEEIVQTPIRLSQGKEQSIIFNRDLLSKTKQSFFVLGWNFDNKKSVFDVIKRVRLLKERGVDVRFLFTHKTAVGDYFRELLDKEGIKYRFVQTGYISIVISDASRSKITLKRKELPEQVNLAIEEVDLAQAMHQYFLKMWRSGTKK